MYLWRKSNIPHQDEKACVRSIERLFDSWSEFITNNRKNLVIVSAKYEKYKKYTSGMLDISSGRNENELKNILRSTRLSTWEDEWEFYQNQKHGDRLMSMEGLDKKTSDKINRSISRNFNNGSTPSSSREVQAPTSHSTPKRAKMSDAMNIEEISDIEADSDEQSDQEAD